MASARMLVKPAQLSGIGTTFTLFKDNADSTAPVIVYMPGSSRLQGKPFKVVASGEVTTGATTNVTVTLQYGTSATTGSNTTIEASSAVAVNTTSSPFLIEAFLIVDATLQTLRGWGRSVVAGTRVASATLDNAPTSVDPTAGDDKTQGFVVGITFSVPNASNTADLRDFYLEALT